ncbi:flagellar hook-length control protein FliK [Roseibium sp.]|uniref:flagellar hook-length control protein FliK n=2 Tax=Roseibium sp. TaxID=1936156 RepID=UPI003266849D
MLPIGMFTDVSAGALDSAAGVVPFSGSKEVAGAFQSFLAEGQSDGSPEALPVDFSLEGQSIPVDGQSAELPGGKLFGDQMSGPELSALLGDGDVPIGNAMDPAALPEDVAPDEMESAEIASEDLVVSPDVPQIGEELLHGQPAAALGGALVSSDVSVAGSGGASDRRGVGDVGNAAAGMGGEQPSSGGADAKRPGLAASSGEAGSGVPGESGKAPALPAQAEASHVSAAADRGLPNGLDARADSALPDAGLKDPIVRPGNENTRLGIASGFLSSVDSEIDLPTAARASVSTANVPSGDEAPIAGKPDEVPTAAAVATEPTARRWKTDLPEIARASTAPQTVLVQPKSASSAAVSDPVMVPGPETVDGSFAELDQRSLSEVSKTPSQIQSNANAAISAGRVSPNGQGIDAGVVGNAATSAADSGEAAQGLDIEAAFDEGEPGFSARPQVGDVRADSAVRANGAPSPAGNTPETGASGATAQSSVPLAAAVTGTLGSEQDLGGDEELDLAFDVKSLAKGELTGSSRAESAQTTSRMMNNPAAVQVAGAIARNLQDGHTRFQMRFDPPELGRVDVNMKMAADGSVQAHLIVERPETLDMFMRDQRALERALEAAGLNTDSESLQFSLKQDGEQGFASSQGDDGGFAEGRDSNEEVVSAEDVANEQVTQIYLAKNTSGLDIRI